jgi:hypothetical protein
MNAFVIGMKVSGGQTSLKSTTLKPTLLTIWTSRLSDARNHRIKFCCEILAVYAGLNSDGRLLNDFLVPQTTKVIAI